LGDVERAILERDAVRPIKTRRKNLDRPFAVLVDDRIDLVDEAAADKYCTLVAYRQRTGVRHAGGVNFNIEAGRYFKLCQRQLVRRGRERRRRDRRKLRRGFAVGPPDQGRTGRKRRCGSRRRCGWRIGWLLRGSTERTHTDKGAGEQQAARRRADLHVVLPFGGCRYPGAGNIAGAGGFLSATLRYFSVDAQSETFGSGRVGPRGNCCRPQGIVSGRANPEF